MIQEQALKLFRRVSRKKAMQVLSPLSVLPLAACGGDTSVVNKDYSGVTPAYNPSDLYKSGSLIPDATNGSWFDRSIEVYGIELVVAGVVGGQSAVPDEWALKTAQTSMVATLAGKEGTWHAGLQTGQRIAKGGGEDYSPNPLRETDKYSGYDQWNDSHAANDMVWYQNSSDGLVTNKGDTDIQEILEHVMHTVHLFGVRGAVNGSYEALSGSLETDTGYKSQDLWLAMQEAISSGIYSPPAETPNFVAIKEYTYLLNFGMWEFGSEFWPDKDANDLGSLSPEWADSARTPEGIQSNNPLGYALFNTYFAPVLTKPSITALRNMFQDNDGGVSGYVADNYSSSAYLIPQDDYDTQIQGSSDAEGFSLNHFGVEANPGILDASSSMIA